MNNFPQPKYYGLSDLQRTCIKTWILSKSISEQTAEVRKICKLIKFLSKHKGRKWPMLRMLRLAMKAAIKASYIGACAQQVTAELKSIPYRSGPNVGNYSTPLMLPPPQNESIITTNHP